LAGLDRFFISGSGFSDSRQPTACLSNRFFISEGIPTV